MINGGNVFSDLRNIEEESFVSADKFITTKPKKKRLFGVEVDDDEVDDSFVDMADDEPINPIDFSNPGLPKMDLNKKVYKEEVEEAIVSADNFTTEPRHIKKAFGKWSIPDDDGDGDIDGDDFNAFMKAHYSEAGLDSSNWTPDMWATARSFYGESLTEADMNKFKEMAKNFDVEKAKEGIKKCANTAKNLINNNEKLNQFLDKAEAYLSKSSSKGLQKAATVISMIRDYASGAYTEIPTNAIIGLVACLVYMVLPVDIIPDVIPVVGMVDDIGVVMVTIKSFDKDIDNYIAWKNSQGKAKKTESLEEAVVDDATGKEILNYVKKYLPQNKPVGLRYNPANVPAIRDFLHKNGYQTDYDDRNNVIHVKK